MIATEKKECARRVRHGPLIDLRASGGGGDSGPEPGAQRVRDAAGMDSDCHILRHQALILSWTSFEAGLIDFGVEGS